MKLEERTKLIKDFAKERDTVALSIYLLEDNPGLIKCEKNIYLYNGKCYDLITEHDILRMFHKFIIQYGITQIWAKRGDVLSSVLSYEKLTTVKKMNDHEDLMCLNNGIINIKTRELIPHSPNYYFDSLINVDYDPANTNCPAFTKYLNDTFSNEEDIINNIIMLGGYLLDSSCKAERMFIFNGPAGAGKSVLINTFSMFFADSPLNPQVTAISLEDLAGDKFNKRDLITSRFNQCAEAKGGYIESEEIKKIVTGDLINVRGIYQPTITFRPKTKIIIACNSLMKFADTSDGIFRRLVIFNFENQFRDPSEIEHIKDAEKRHIYPWDLELPKKLQAEKSAILNLFLDGLVMLQKRKYQFIFTDRMRKFVSEYKKDSDTVREFLENNYEINEGHKTPITDVYNHYRSWYRHNVQDSYGMKMRSNEMAKRITEVFNVKSSGREYLTNKESGDVEYVTVYPIKKKVYQLATPDFDINKAIPYKDNDLGI